ncbi:hypothetical protein A8135_05800 [Legionella jamestowniensis]|uniref:Uncharacterized protein n=1 Tax=Legionella jamestowniensis TaxID=455 RepID=A0ABX2XT98_9GAMM|nr:hypothetical protein [Legionella jamestowniensis]OCH97139.1 hypothetical protein A8135_05800 [Legionella jamestowniensis]
MEKSSPGSSRKQSKPKVKKNDLKNISGGTRLKDVFDPPAHNESPHDSDDIRRLIREGIKR